MAASLGTSSFASAIGPTHPHYAIWAPTWRRLAHVYEGSGGFLDGTYLIPHPREWEDHGSPVYEGDGENRKQTGWQVNPNPTRPTAKLLERRRLARYENVAATIVDQKASALFREGPSRQVSTKGAKGEEAEHAWLDWCEDVDGEGTCLDDFMKEAWRLAAITGHSVIYMDRPKTDNPPVTQADVLQPILRLYAALDMPNWLVDDGGHLKAVRLLEAVPADSFDQQMTAEMLSARVRIIDRETWKVVDETKAGPTAQTVVKDGGSGVHGFGRLPIVILYAQRRALYPIIGKAVLADPQLFIDLYNLISETRELLRKQTFSMLNIPLGVGDQAISIQDAQTQAGSSTGTANVLFSAHQASFITADSGNVAIYQEERAQLLRTIYRLSAVPWESDSKDAEAVGSMKLKREDMNQVLAFYGDECEKAEYSLAELFFRATYGVDRWKQEWDAADPVIRYPDTFQMDPFQDMLTQAQAAMALPLGQSKQFMLEMCRRLITRFLPDASAETIDGIMKEIEALPTPQQEKLARLEQMASAFANTPEEGAQKAAEAQGADVPMDQAALAGAAA